MPRSRLTRRLLALLVGPALFLAAEATLRLAGVAVPPVRTAGARGLSLFHEETDASGHLILATRPEHLGTFNRQTFPSRKARGTTRIFCLGGSSTFGFPGTAESSFCAGLGRTLEASRPGTRVEAVNAGGMSYGAQRVLSVLEEVVEYEPDALVVYSGHNEYVERRMAPPPGVVTALNRLRLVRLLRSATGGGIPAGRGDNFFGVGPVRDDSRRIPRTGKEDAVVRAAYGAALRRMAQTAADAGVGLHLVLPASNLRDWAPEASTWLKGDSRWRLESARDVLAGGLPERAAALADLLLADEPGAAGVHYLRGQLREAEGDPGRARVAYRMARDLDAVPIRITSGLEAEVAGTWNDQKLVPLDAQAALAAASPQGLVGHAMVLDYCHPSRRGHGEIVRLLTPALAATLWPGQFFRPAAPVQLPESRPASAFGAAWSGQMALRQGDLEGAADLFTVALDRDPDLATAHEGRGRVLAARGDLAGATAALERAVRLAPQVDTGWNNLGLVYLATARHAEAVRAFRTALARGPGRPLVRVNLARALRRTGELDEALREARQALAESPSLALAWWVLAELEADAGRPEAAGDARRRALELNPALAPASADSAAPVKKGVEMPTPDAGKR